MTKHIISDIDANIWVEANAGTGKTTSIVSRILSLLLSGVELDRIVCLTYTRSAANEVYQRIISRLISWKEASDQELVSDLSKIFDSPESYLKIARNIYSEILTKNQKHRIQTIHSFCFENIIQKNFNNIKIADDIRITEIKNDIFSEMLSSDSILDNKTKLMNEFLKNYSKNDLAKIIEFTIYNKNFIDALLLKYNLSNYSELIDISNKIFDENEWNFFLKNSCEKFSKLIELDLAPFFDDSNKLEAIFERLIDSKTQNIKKSLVKKFQDESLVLDIQNSYSRFKIYELYQKDKLFIDIIGFVKSRIDELMDKLSILTFDDVLFFSLKILENEKNQTILYKNDITIKHLIIDEAQDLNEISWKIINKLTEEFFTGFGSFDSQIRTLFVAGDPKQSIFSFQGARPDLFYTNMLFCREKSKLINRKFLKLNLNISYRNTDAILRVVNKFCNHFEYKKSLFIEDNISHIPHKQEEGKIEIININSPKKHDKTDSWIANLNLKRNCDKILKTIKASLDIIKNLEKNENICLLFSTRTSNGEIMRKVYQELLKNFPEDIFYIGSDDILIEQLDLVSFLKFFAFPFDNLNLSVLLKSPFFNLTDLDLIELVSSSKKKFLFQKIEEYNSVNRRIIFAKNIIKSLNLSNLSIQKLLNSISDFLSALSLKNKDLYLIIINAILKILSEDFNLNLDNLIKLLEEKSFSKSDLEIKVKKINISTIHMSKGMEFDNIIIFDFIDQINYLKLPILILKNERFLTTDKDLIKKEEKERSFHEKNRLAYVALTRARKNINIITDSDENEMMFGKIFSNLPAD